eukprot:15455822-Alexandrium_andersonii.AAC.1
MLVRFGLPANAVRAAAALAVSGNGAVSGASSSGDAFRCPGSGAGSRSSSGAAQASVRAAGQRTGYPYIHTSEGLPTLLWRWCEEDGSWDGESKEANAG